MVGLGATVRTALSSPTVEGKPVGAIEIPVSVPATGDKEGEIPFSPPSLGSDFALVGADVGSLFALP